MIRKAFFLVGLSLLSVLLLGNIYFWTDGKGIRHYSNVTVPDGKTAITLKESRTVYKKLKSSENSRHSFTVLKVYDGDTILVKGLDLVFKIRLVGIDAPETGFKGERGQPYCQKSKSHLHRLVNQRQVSLKSHGIGGYNRQLAEVFVDNINVNLEMVRRGFAEVYRGQRPSALDSERYFKAEQDARQRKAGIWSRGTYKSPRQWRKEHPRR